MAINIDLFWHKIKDRKIINENGCWLFTGSIDSILGYGRIQIYAVRLHVHRIACAKFHNLNLKDKKQFACHKCENRNCFNPEHLYVGDNTDNQRDVWKDNRCKNGHDLTIHGRTGTYSGRRFCRICATIASKKLRDFKKATTVANREEKVAI